MARKNKNRIKKVQQALEKRLMLDGALAISIIDATFDAGSTPFTYSDGGFGGGDPSGVDLARNTSGGGILQVELGGIDGADESDISGSFDTTINLATAVTNASLSFNYRLEASAQFEANENFSVLVDVDGTETTVFFESGNGNGGPIVDTGFITFNLDLGNLAAGNHDISLGGFLSEKTFADEWTRVSFDNVALSGDVQVVNTSISGNEDTQQTLDVSQPDPNLTYSISDAPTNGTATINASGVITYDPDADFNGTDSIEYQISTTSPGLAYEFFDSLPTGNTVNNIPTTGADFTGFATDLNVSALANSLTGSTDTYAVRYTGDLEIVTAGTYDFSTRSDDGSALFIDGCLLYTSDAADE